MTRSRSPDEKKLGRDGRRWRDDWPRTGAGQVEGDGRERSVSERRVLGRRIGIRFCLIRSSQSDETLRQSVAQGVTTRILFDPDACARIEEKIEDVCLSADRGAYKTCTVDRAPLRNK